MFTSLTTAVNKQEPVRDIRPQPRQEQFLMSSADIVIYGGAAGGGKTWSLLLEPLRHIKRRGFGATIFRRSYPEITMEGGLAEKAAEVYPHTGGTGLNDNMRWHWRHGSRVEMRHLADDSTLMDYLGAQITLLEFDQLETFTAKMFWYMLSRNRSNCGIRPYVRATCNPDPDSFLRELIDWWIAPDGYADLSRSGQVRWLVRVSDVVYWADSKQELVDQFAHLEDPPEPLSFTFILATLDDNQELTKADPGYRSKLQALDYIDQQRLLGDRKRGGNWNVRAEAGKVFNRSWFEIVDHVPAGGLTGRGWDFAGTLKEIKGTDPDHVASCRMRLVYGDVYILDATDEVLNAAEVHPFVKALADQDAMDETTARNIIRWEQEPASAAIRDTVALTRLLNRYEPGGIPSNTNKLARWKPLAAQAVNGRVKLLRGAWNNAWLSQMHGQPDLKHDDTPDAASVIYNALVRLPKQEPRGSQVRRKVSPLAEAFNGRK